MLLKYREFQRLNEDWLSKKLITLYGPNKQYLTNFARAWQTLSGFIKINVNDPASTTTDTEFKSMCVLALKNSSAILIRFYDKCTELNDILQTLENSQDFLNNFRDETLAKYPNSEKKILLAFSQVINTIVSIIINQKGLMVKEIQKLMPKKNPKIIEDESSVISKERMKAKDFTKRMIIMATNQINDLDLTTFFPTDEDTVTEGILDNRFEMGEYDNDFNKELYRKYKTYIGEDYIFLYWKRIEKDKQSIVEKGTNKFILQDIKLDSIGKKEWAMSLFFLDPWEEIFKVTIGSHTNIKTIDLNNYDESNDYKNLIGYYDIDKKLSAKNEGKITLSPKSYPALMLLKFIKNDVIFLNRHSPIKIPNF